MGIDVWNGSQSDVQGFKSTTGIQYPLLLNGGATQSRYGVSRDHSIVIDQEGIVRYEGNGVNTSEINNTIEGLMATSADDPVQNPEQFELIGNYPNPFNAGTTIRFTVDEYQTVSLKIYDFRGRLVRTLLDEPMAMGQHSIRWNGRDANGHSTASGIYFMQLSGAGRIETKKMMLLQ